jgi:hypothetical protein
MWPLCSGSLKQQLMVQGVAAAAVGLVQAQQDPLASGQSKCSVQRMSSCAGKRCKYNLFFACA